jgi:sporulation protein YlmC with PRC-barrel domain
MCLQIADIQGQKIDQRQGGECLPPLNCCWWRAVPEVETFKSSNRRETVMNSNSREKMPAGRTNTWAGCYALDAHRTGRRSTRANGGIFFATTAVTLLIANMFLFVIIAKPALSQGVHLVKVDVSVLAHGYRVSKLIGSSVANDKNEKIGSIDDMIVDQNKIMFAVLQVGGFLGLGKHLVAVPYDSLKIEDDGKKIVLPGASKDELKELAEFKYVS